MADKPAILGGTPAFEKTFPIIRPSADEAATPQLLDRMAEVLRSNMLSNVGIFVRRLEEELERRLRVDHVVATSSCTVGLILALHALGVKGGQVAAPSFTFNATGLAIYWTRNEPTYVDIDETFTMNPRLLPRSKTRIRALLPVHMYGNSADVDGLAEAAERMRVPIVYDAAHALGSSLNKKPLGGFGTAEVFSLSPTKLITTGEGGIVATNDEELDGQLRLLRNYGNKPDYSCDVPGINGRMSEINAVLGLEMLSHLDRYVELRNRYVDRYKHRLDAIEGLGFQRIRPGTVSGHKDFGVLIDPVRFGLDRDQLSKALEAERISTKKYFYPPMHMLKAFRSSRRPRLPITNRVSRRILSLPIHNVMREADIDRITERIALIQGRASAVKQALAIAG